MSSETDRTSSARGDSDRTGAAAGAFSPDEYFLGAAMRAAKPGAGVTRVVHEDLGEVVIDGARARYAAKVPDWVRFCTAPAASLKVSTLRVSMISPQDERDLAELLWIAGYHASIGRLPAGSNRHDILKLRHWPNLSRLPSTPDMFRLCALLARRPSSITLAGKLVDVDESTAFRFFSAAQAGGAIEVVSRAFDPAAAAREAEQSAQTAETSLSTMLRQLWNKMTGL